MLYPLSYRGSGSTIAGECGPDKLEPEMPDSGARHCVDNVWVGLKPAPTQVRCDRA